jgi:hypothetical protein
VAGRVALVAAAVCLIGAAPRKDPVEAALRAHIEILASDEFDGREPGTEGETKTLRYLARQWFDMGLVSGTNTPGKDWFAPVELVERTPLAWRATFFRGKKKVAVPEGSVFVVTSGLRSLAEAAPVLFVGHAAGPVPPRVELAGRIALMLDSKPDGTPPADRAGALLEGGASAVITVLDSELGIEDVIARRQRAGYALAGDNLGGDLEAFISPLAAAALLPRDSDLATLRKQADAPGFAPRPLPFTATLEATSKETRINTHNLIGRIPGRNPEAGAVLLVAHWDHFGECAAPPAEDLICNGAIDNASGVAVITEVARAIARGRQLDRDVYVLATTGEELGLLGALAFAENPPLPLGRIVAAFNVDSNALVPRGLPVTIIGKGMTGLDADIEKVAKKLKRRIVPGDAANIYVRRQDIWALMQHDVPTVMVSSAYSDPARLDQFMEDTYHRPNDQATNLELGGAAEDVALHIELVRWFGSTRSYPARQARPGKSP